MLAIGEGADEKIGTSEARGDKIVCARKRRAAKRYK